MAKFTPRFHPTPDRKYFTYTDEHGVEHTIKFSERGRVIQEYADKNRAYEITDNEGNVTNTYDMGGDTIGPITGWGDGYRTNNILRRGDMEDVRKAFRFLVENNRMPTAAELGVGKGAYENIKYDVKVMSERNGVALKEDAYGTLIIAGGTNVPQALAEKIEAEIDEASGPDPLNAYYNDLYSLDEGTGGRAMYDALLNANMAEARAGYNVADLQQQQAAMQQAATVKQIADQVRSERMARLRAGMSESQIANQDMQMMMTNVQALNDQSLAASQARYDAMTGMELAQHNAYREYLAQADARGQVSAAMAATDAGNPITIADQYRSRLLQDPAYDTFYDPVIGRPKDE